MKFVIVDEARAIFEGRLVTVFVLDDGRILMGENDRLSWVKVKGKTE